MEERREGKRKLLIGAEDFSELRSGQYYFVDKSLLIRDLLENPAKVTLFTRPRRFGKTLNLSMLKWFFELPEEALYGHQNSLPQGVSAGEWCRELFDSLNITEEKELCGRYAHSYPVISISLKGVDKDSFEESLNALRAVIAREAGRFAFLRESECLSEEERESLAALTRRDRTGRRTYAMSSDELTTSLKTLTDLLYTHYGKRVIVLIDEYDVPLNKAHLHGYYDQMVEMIRGLFNEALKTNPSLEFAVLTGCLRISKESIFTGMNNLRVNTIADPQFNAYFGFTDEEVCQLLDYYGIGELHERIRDWYDGYNFAGVHVYCPWDVALYCSYVLAVGESEPENYWTNTSGNDIVIELIESASPGTKRKIESLIAGESVTEMLSEEISYRDLGEKQSDIFSILFHTGYLTMDSIRRNQEGTDWYELRIPNAEIRVLFRRQIRRWFDRKIAGNKDLADSFYRAVISREPQEMERILNGIMVEAISIRDYGVRDELRENFYQGMMIGLLGSRADARVGQESGRGYPDLMIRDYVSRTGVILELKYSRDFRELDSACDAALEQISDRAYETELLGEGMTRIYRYGIAFFRKVCRVKWMPGDNGSARTSAVPLRSCEKC